MGADLSMRLEAHGGAQKKITHTPLSPFCRSRFVTCSGTLGSGYKPEPAKREAWKKTKIVAVPILSFYPILSYFILFYRDTCAEILIRNNLDIFI